MYAVEWALLVVGIFGLITSSIFLGMVLVGARRFRHRAMIEEMRLAERPLFLPPISLFKPLHGDEVGLEANLRTFFEQDYLEYAAKAGALAEKNGVSRVEVLFCARSQADEGLEVARRVAADYPEITARFLTSGEPWAANAKVCSLAVMAQGGNARSVGDQRQRCAGDAGLSAAGCAAVCRMTRWVARRVYTAAWWSGVACGRNWRRWG